MKRNVILAIALCLSLISYAQKAPKRSFLTETEPAEVKWQNGELVNFSDASDGQGVNYYIDKADGKTFFMGRGACRSDEGDWLALYPAGALNFWEGSCMHFLIPHEQVANKTANPMYSRTQTIAMDFKPLTAYLSFELAPGQPPVKEIRFKTNKFISGTYKVDVSMKTVSVQLDTGENRYREIVLKPGESGVIEPGTYTMAIYARVLPDGMTVEIESVDGKVEVRKIARELKFALGKTRDFGVLTNLKFDADSKSTVGEKYGDVGVIFWNNPDDPTRGKAVAATASLMNWSAANSLHGIHTFKDNYELVHSTVTNLPAYKASPEDYPAVNACEEMRKTYGGNWHVPSAREMKYLFNAYYGKSDLALPENGEEYTDEASQQAAARFDAQLVALGGEKLLAMSNHYWICGQNSSGNMQYVNMRKFYHSHAEQTQKKYVRCVCDFHGTVTGENTSSPQTEVGKTLESDKCSKIIDVLWDTTFTVTKGLEYYQMEILTESHEKMDIYLLRVDQSQGLDVRAATSGNVTSSEWVRQVPSEMAVHMDSPEKPLYALVNADFCENRIPIRPRGPHHSDGKIWVSSYSIDPRLPQQALSYVGVTFDGKMVIGPSSEYQGAKKSLKECTGAGVILLKDYVIQGGYVLDPGRDPRTALGYTADNIVWILAVDGRHKGTNGMNYMEMASLFQALGCIDAVNLDGGGSTQMVVRDPNTNKLEMRNWPSDPTNGFGGRERARLNGWCIIKH